MERNKNIGKVLFQFEKTALLIISMILLGNTTVNLLVFLLVDTLTFSYFIGQLANNLFLFAFIYVMTYGVNQVITAVPFLVSLNSPRKILAKTLIINGINRGFLITLIFLLAKVILNKTGYWSVASIIGIDLGSISIIDNLVLAVTVFLLLSISNSFITFIGLVGMKFGWEYLLTIIFIVLGTGFFLARSLILLGFFGWGLDIFISLLILFLTGFIFINYKLIRNFEYKY